MNFCTSESCSELWSTEKCRKDRTGGREQSEVEDAEHEVNAKLPHQQDQSRGSSTVAQQVRRAAALQARLAAQSPRVFVQQAKASQASIEKFAESTTAVSRVSSECSSFGRRDRRLLCEGNRKRRSLDPAETRGHHARLSWNGWCAQAAAKQRMLD